MSRPLDNYFPWIQWLSDASSVLRKYSFLAVLSQPWRRRPVAVIVPEEIVIPRDATHNIAPFLSTMQAIPNVVVSTAAATAS